MSLNAEQHQASLAKPLAIPADISLFIKRGTGNLVTHLSLLEGGVNNQVLLAECGKHRYVIKQYWQTNGAVTAKHCAEAAFYQLIKQHSNSEKSVAFCPTFIASDVDNRLLLLSYVAQQQTIEQALQDYQQTASEQAFFARFVTRSIDFMTAVNDKNVAAQNIPLAADATASISQLIEQLSHRKQRLIDGVLKNLETADDSTKPVLLACQALITNTLIPWLETSKAKAEQFKDIAFALELASPSDFGLHNVLLEEATNEFVFIDFEYAGKDSAIKFISDYFCQPRFPIPITFINSFYQQTLFKSAFINLELFFAFFSATQLKWCFILLNEFIPSVATRRQFSCAEQLNMAQQQKLQLAKCQQYIADAQERYNQLVVLSKSWRLEGEDDTSAKHPRSC